MEYGNNDYNLFGEFSQWQRNLFLGFIVLVLGILVFAVLAATWYLISDEIALAETYAGITVGFATILLVIVAGWYAMETRRLVSQAEETRKQEKELRETEWERDVNKIRFALLKEISAMAELDELARTYTPEVSIYTQIVPSVVYESNAGDIGSLTADEIEAVIEYYTIAEMTEDILAIQRKLDTNFNRSIMEIMWRTISFSGWFFQRERQARTDATKEKLRDLASAQQSAKTVLENNLADQ